MASAVQRRAGAALEWLAWLLALAAVTAALVLVRPHLDRAHVALAYLLLVLAASTRGPRVRGLLVALLSFLSFNFFFLPPYGTFAIREPLDWLVLLTYLVVAGVASHLLFRARSQADEARTRAREMEHLSTLGAETLNAGRAEDALAAVADVIRATLRVDACEIWLLHPTAEPLRLTLGARAGGNAPGSEGEAAPPAAYAAAERGESVSEQADGTTRLAPAHGQGGEVKVPEAAGARALALPLRVHERTVGVLRVARAAGLGLDPAQRRFFAVLAYYAALGAERVRLAAEAGRAQALGEADRLKDALIASVSHDLRTPLTTIKALAHELRESGDERAVIIEEEADRLNRFVADLLDLSRLNAGELRVAPEIVAAEDLVGAALQRVSGSLGEREIRVDLHPSEPLLLGRLDFVHSLRVLVNLLENAHKYAPAGTPIDLAAAREGDRLVVRVADRGAGVPDEERERIFQPFYRRADALADAGTGLGLSISRRLADAQGGSLTVQPRPGGGSVFTLSLPAADLPADTLDT
ncbi:MAG TPA: ATP-binding protein [Longimicrobiaceae bacterium]|nr:ATP-binding protein [Longimicrobiaceae bacterium]